MVVPALAALLPDATRETLGDLSPVAWTMLRDEVNEDFVFFKSPGASDTVTDIVEL